MEVRTLMRWSALCGLALVACGGSDVIVDLETVPSAKAGCEAPTPAQLRVDALMLPGRNCQGCHVPSGQASKYRLIISGTVFRNLAAPCNTGGVNGVKVEILDVAGKVLTTLTSNAAGNFYTDKSVPFPIRARVSKDGVSREMLTSTSVGSCAACHAKEPKFGAKGVLNLTP